MDLFAVARENADSLQREFDDLLSRPPSSAADCIERFAERAKQEGRITINMLQKDLNSFLTSGKYQNRYERARKLSTRSTKSVEEILRDELGEKYEPRVTFDRHFDKGEQFRDGALNIGGLGAAEYGSHCTVLKDNVSSGRSEVAYLRSDILESYMLPGTAVNEEAIRKDAASHTHRQYLVALKHASDIPRTPEHRWPSMVCSSVGYVKAIFTGEVTPGDMEAVRIGRSLYRALWHLPVEAHQGKLIRSERFTARDFVSIRLRLREYAVPLEVLDDA